MPFPSTVDAGIVPSLSTLDARYVQQGALCINVKDHGALGDGVTDDTIAIQAAFNAAVTGSVIFFPQGTYLVTASLLFPGNIKILGSGASDGDTVIKVKTGTALTTPILCSSDWYNNAATCGNPVEISDIKIDGNSATSGSGAHGFVAMNYWSRFDSVFVNNVAGDGFLFSAQTRNGTHISNTCVEPKIRRVEVRTSGGDGIHIKDNGSGLNSCTDGWMENCLVTGAGAKGINIEMGPGWHITGNHVYGTVNDAISVSRCYATRVHGNYIDGFGSGSSTYIAGIGMDVLDGRGSSCIGNHVGFESGAATGPYQGFRITGAGSAAATCAMMANSVKGGNQSGSIAYVLQTNVSQQGQPWTVYFDDNDSMNVATRLYQDSYVTGGDLKLLGHMGSEGPAVTAAAGANAGTSPPSPVLTRATDLAGKVTFGTGTGPAAGAMCVVTFANPYGQNPVPAISPINAASAALNLHVDRTTTTMTVSAGNAPAASQGNTVYGFFYHVFLSV
jgi:hypothetical protein